MITSRKVLAAYHAKMAREHLYKLVRFGIVGVLNTIIYTALLFSFLDLLKWGSFVAVTLSYVLSIAFQFTANKYFTFQANGSVKGQIVRYLATAGISYLGSLLIVWQLSDTMQLPMVYVIAACAFYSASLGYVAGHFWIYR